MKPKKSSYATLSNTALFKLRDEITEVINSRAEDLRRQFYYLTGGGSIVRGGDTHSGGKRRGKQREATRRKVAPKYLGPHGEEWSGRGQKPRWLTKAINEGKQPGDFLIDNQRKETASVEQNRRLQ
jgi:DNA-binding protein H-NS